MGETVPLRVEEIVSDPVVLKDPVAVEDKHRVGELLKDPVTLEDKHKVGEVLTEAVVDKDPVRVPEAQGEGLIVAVEQCVEDTELDGEPLTVTHKVGLFVWVVETLTVLQTVDVTLPVLDTDRVELTVAE